MFGFFLIILFPDKSWRIPSNLIIVEWYLLFVACNLTYLHSASDCQTADGSWSNQATYLAQSVWMNVGTQHIQPTCQSINQRSNIDSVELHIIVSITEVSHFTTLVNRIQQWIWFPCSLWIGLTLTVQLNRRWETMLKTTSSDLVSPISNRRGHQPFH